MLHKDKERTFVATDNVMILIRCIAMMIIIKETTQMKEKKLTTIILTGC